MQNVWGSCRLVDWLSYHAIPFVCVPSFSNCRTAVNSQSGAKTPLGGLFTGEVGMCVCVCMYTCVHVRMYVRTYYYYQTCNACMFTVVQLSASEARSKLILWTMSSMPTEVTSLHCNISLIPGFIRLYTTKRPHLSLHVRVCACNRRHCMYIWVGCGALYLQGLQAHVSA